MTELVREASNWAFRLDLQESERCSAAVCRVSRADVTPLPCWLDSMASSSTIPSLHQSPDMLCFAQWAGIEQVRAQELGMLEEEG